MSSRVRRDRQVYQMICVYNKYYLLTYPAYSAQKRRKPGEFLGNPPRVWTGIPLFKGGAGRVFRGDSSAAAAGPGDRWGGQQKAAKIVKCLEKASKVRKSGEFLGNPPRVWTGIPLFKGGGLLCPHGYRGTGRCTKMVCVYNKYHLLIYLPVPRAKRRKSGEFLGNPPRVWTGIPL